MASLILLSPAGLAPAVSAGSVPSRQRLSLCAASGLVQPPLRPMRVAGRSRLAGGAAVAGTADRLPRSDRKLLRVDRRSAHGSRRTALWLRSLTRGGWRGWPQVLPVVLLLVSAFFWAPEAPQDQAAICQRHNGAAACRVW